MENVEDNNENWVLVCDLQGRRTWKLLYLYTWSKYTRIYPDLPKLYELKNTDGKWRPNGFGVSFQCSSLFC